MKSFIFTAGLGKRLLPITNVVPKPALPLLNIPIVYYALQPLLKAGVKHFVCNLHHLPHIMSKTLSQLKEKASLYFVEEKPDLLGSAGGIYNARDRFQDQEHFFVANGDTVFLPEDPYFLTRVYQEHKSKDALATLVLTPYEHSGQYSLVWFDKKTNKVVGFGHQSPNESAIGGHFTGYYILSNRIFEHLQFANFDTHIFKDILLKLITKGESVFCFHKKGYWFETGDKTNFLETTKTLLELRRRSSYLQDMMSHYLRSKIPADSNILLGQNVCIGENVRLKGCCVIGDNVKLESNICLQDSVVLSGCHIIEKTSICEEVVYQ